MGSVVVIGAANGSDGLKLRRVENDSEEMTVDSGADVG
jgi:hypothetical protein